MMYANPPREWPKCVTVPQVEQGNAVPYNCRGSITRVGHHHFKFTGGGGAIRLALGKEKKLGGRNNQY
jgi:hypothetical protein